MEHLIVDKRQWRTIVEYYDRENGEQLTKSEVERNYVVIKKHKRTYKEDEKYRYNVYIRECERNRQQQINF